MAPKLELRAKLINYLIKNKCECTLTAIGRATPHATKEERNNAIKSLEDEGLITIKKVTKTSINKGVEREYSQTYLLFDYIKHIES